MSGSDGTVRNQTLGIPVREVCAEVVTGPDTGLKATALEGPVSVGTASGNSLVLTDPAVSRYHMELRREGDRIRLTDLGSTNGTRVGPTLVSDARVAVQVGTTIDLGSTQIRLSDGETRMESVEFVAELGALRGRSVAMQQLMRRASQVAKSHVPVLVVGESGTGKELLSRALHEKSARAKGPFVTVDCAAISGQLFSSALFGHERGAFTGAVQRTLGAFERADGGTLFLDEVGELPAQEQSALLGVIERGRFMRLGGTKEISVDVRIVAATNRDLRAEVNRGLFRLDLYYRLAVVQMEIPPLRERPEDLEVLIQRFAHEEGLEATPDSIFGAETLSCLAQHRFPGNVRELRNMVAAAIATGEAPDLMSSLVGTIGTDGAQPQNGVSLAPELLERTYKDAKRAVTGHFDRVYLKRLLERSEGSVRGAARLAKINRTYLIELLDKHGLR